MDLDCKSSLTLIPFVVLCNTNRNSTTVEIKNFLLQMNPEYGVES